MGQWYAKKCYTYKNFYTLEYKKYVKIYVEGWLICYDAIFSKLFQY